MPCQFIASCFYLENPWASQSDSASGSGNPAKAASHHPDVINQEPQEPQEQVAPAPDQADLAAIIAGPDPAAANVETQAKPATGGEVSTSPNGTPDKASKARAAKTFRAYLPSQCHRTYSCVHCRAHLANHDELISKSFQGSQGRAYLFNSVVNIGCGQAEERVLLTGLHAVADIYCDCCKTVLGWKYEQAYESSQKYKEGKFIIELAHMIKENGWENES